MMALVLTILIIHYLQMLKLHSSHKNIIDEGSMLIKDGKIIAVGKTVDIPENSIIVDLERKINIPFVH